MFTAVYQLKPLPQHYSTVYAALNRKVKSFKQIVFLSKSYNKHSKCCLLALISDYNHFCHLFIALLTIHCSKSAQTSAVSGVSRRYYCYGKLVLSQFKHVCHSQLRRQ